MNENAPRAASTCLHLFCGECVEEIFEGARSTSDRPEGIERAVPDEDRLADDQVRSPQPPSRTREVSSSRSLFSRRLVEILPI